MGPDNPPLYVQSVTYGRIVMVSFTSTAAQVREVLSNISRLLIRAEFASGETDFVVVDLVRFDPSEVPTGF